MDYFFSFQNQYVINDTKDHVQSQIEAIVGRHWSDLSDNITGKLMEDGRFQFTPKWTLGLIQSLGFHQSFTYLTGSLMEDKGKTIIRTKARPNYGFVMAFYFLVFIIVARVLGVNILRNENLGQLFLSLFPICLVLAGLMIFVTLKLRSRFERLMQLRREES